MIRFNCPACGFSLSAPEEFSGRPSKCRQCGGAVTIPLPVSSSPNPRIQRPSIPGKKSSVQVVRKPERRSAVMPVADKSPPKPGSKKLLVYSIVLVAVFLSGALSSVALMHYLTPERKASEVKSVAQLDPGERAAPDPKEQIPNGGNSTDAPADLNKLQASQDERPKSKEPASAPQIARIQPSKSDPPKEEPRQLPGKPQIPLPENKPVAPQTPAIAVNLDALPALGGFAVSSDNSILVVSLTSKAQLLYYDTVAGRAVKLLDVEFQPTQLAWHGKILFAAQKGSGLVHILDADSGKELKTASAGGPVRNLVCAKGLCFASTDNREVSIIDAEGNATKSSATGTFIAADPNEAFVCTVIDGRARTDIMKYTIDGKSLQPAGMLQGVTGRSLINVSAVRISGDGKQVGVVAGGGWSSVDRQRHYGVPLYSTADMHTMVGALETGPYPSGCAFHSALPLVFACTGKRGTVFNAKSLAAGQSFEVPRQGLAAVLAFVAKGRKLAWGTSDARTNTGALRFFDLALTAQQQAQLDKTYAGR
jgi:hypothetical protein